MNSKNTSYNQILDKILSDKKKKINLLEKILKICDVNIPKNKLSGVN